MRAYHAVSHVLPLLVVALAGSTSSWASARAESGIDRRPSAVLGEAKSCPNRVWTIKQVSGCSAVDGAPDDQALAQEATDALNTLVKSDQFKAALLAANFDPAQMTRKCEGELCNVPITREQLFELMVKNSPQKINVTLYLHHWPDRGNEGFEDDKSLDTVFGNRAKIDGSRGFLASLMLHEWMHILGFRHDEDNATCRSVPYEMNVIYAQVAANSPELKLPTTTTGCSRTQ